MKLLALFIFKIILLNLQIQKSDGIIIFCAFELDFPAYKCTSMYMVNLANRNLEAVTGTHEEGLTNEDVDALTIIVLDETILDYIPENITDIFPKLSLFTISMTKIARITSDDLRQLPDLKVFDSAFNPITSLPGDLFKYNPKLRRVGFRGSMTSTPTMDDSISEIGENIFGGLEYLSEAFFVRHFCIETNEYAFTREEVIDLNQRLPVMCPFATEPTDAPTTNEPDELLSLSSHILDISLGKPAENVTITLNKFVNGEWITTSGNSKLTNADGRARDFEQIGDSQLGIYKMRFEIDEYFDNIGTDRLYPFIEITFEITDLTHYHIPLLLSPFGYSTYRGS